MAAWQADALPTSPRRDLVLFAATHHDDGWLEVDRAPLVHAGQVLDFIDAPDEVRLSVWPRAVQRLAERPYVAALVAQHAMRIHEPYRGKKDLGNFFGLMETLRDRHLADARPLTRTDLINDYLFVGMGDTLSLTFCNAWTEPRRQAHYEIRLNGSRLNIDPDPFGGREVPLAVTARRLPNRAFTHEEALEAFDTARMVILTAVASGPAQK